MERLSGRAVLTLAVICMIAFSHADTPDELAKAIAGLPAEKGVEEEIKILAVEMLKRVEQPKAHINLNVHFLPAINAQQVEIQIRGMKA